MRPARALDDELLASLIAAGSADLLVALPTRGDAETVGPVVGAVVAALTGPFVRERAVILNIDAGSADGTPAVFKAAGTGVSGLPRSQQALRSCHPIATSLGELASRRDVLRLLFTIADLLRARAVVLLDPRAGALEAEAVARWITVILKDGGDYAKPAFRRGPLEGPLVTQLVRPLLTAACGVELLEPLDTQLACSGRFAQAALSGDFWGSPFSEIGIDAFLSARAMSGEYRLRQVASRRGQPTFVQTPSVSEVFGQVVGATLASLSGDTNWVDFDQVKAAPIEGELLAPSAAEADFDTGELADAFRLGLDALSPFLGAVLGQSLLERLQSIAVASPPLVDDRLWAEVVFRFVAAARRKETPTSRLAQMLEPLYLGRLASYVERTRAGEAHDASLAQLASSFGTQKTLFSAEMRAGREP